MESKIFHLDDDPDQIRLVEKYITKEMGLDYKGFGKSSEFKASFKVRKPELVIIDLDLEEGDNEGFEVLKYIRNELNSDANIIIMSRRGAIEDINYGTELGADDYITKPVDFQILKTKIKNLMGEVNELNFPFRKFKNEHVGKMQFNLSLTKIDESYIYFYSDHYILKQSKIIVENEVFHKLFKKERVKLVVHDSSIDESNGKYLWKTTIENVNDEYFQRLSNFILRAGS